MSEKIRICGLNKTTLLDYPGRVAATVFLGGCNFRCPFCQNGGLVLRPKEQPEILREEVLAFLKKRKGILDGVCITGGEPTLNSAVMDFIEEIRSLGYPVKLDTNGTNPALLQELIERDLISMAAMDIKAGPSGYERLTGVSHPDLKAVSESAALLMKGRIAYEFRTTVVKELHTEKDFYEIGAWLSGAEAFFLQNYRDSDEVINRVFHSCTEEELLGYLEILKKKIPAARIRGEES